MLICFPLDCIVPHVPSRHVQSSTPRLSNAPATDEPINNPNESVSLFKKFQLSFTLLVAPSSGSILFLLANRRSQQHLVKDRHPHTSRFANEHIRPDQMQNNARSCTSLYFTHSLKVMSSQCLCIQPGGTISMPLNCEDERGMPWRSRSS